MKQNLKYSVGADISKESFDACVSVIDAGQKVVIIATRKFGNTKTGFSEFFNWVNKHLKEDLPVVITMEATGVYYEELALASFEKSFYVSVVLPNRAKKYLQSKGFKSKNDKIDAKGLSQMGAEQCLDAWEPYSRNIYALRSLTRHHESLQALRTSTNNRLEAFKCSGYENKIVEKQLLSMLKLIDKQIAEAKKQIVQLVDEDELLKERVAKISKILGLGVLSITTIIAETNGFKLIKNQRQLVSYAGYDIVENQSGKHTGKTRISKKGNSHIRRILHMPALNVVKFEQAGFKALYDRIYQRTGLKMKSYVAVQRKLLMLIYTLWKNNEEFDPSYYRNNDKTTGDKEPKLLFLHSSEGDIKKVGGRTPPTQDKPPYDKSPEVLFSLLQN
jgi:transposase